MRVFSDIARERVLKKFLASSVGLLFYGADAAGRTIVRRFPSKNLAQDYMEIFYAVKSWVSERQEICAFVEVQIPFEVGTDFIAREHQIYTSTAELLDEENGVVLPDEYFNHRKTIGNALNGGGNSRGQIIEHVVRNSLLEPSGKTYFDFSKKKFVIVEPKILPIDIELWSDSFPE